MFLNVHPAVALRGPALHQGLREFGEKLASDSLVMMVDELGKSTTYDYNLNDWLTRVVYPDGTRTSYAYNGSGDRLSEVIEKPTITRGRVATETNSILYSYDAGGRMVGKASDTFEYDSDGNLVKALENARETAFNWSADNRLIRVAKNKGCAKHNRAKCGACKPAYEVEEYGYLPEEWRRITRTVYEDDGRTCKHGRGYGHGHGHDCGEIPGHGRGHDRDDDDRDDESVYVSVYDNQDESHEYLLKPAKHGGRGNDSRDGHGFGHDKHGKCSKHERCSCPPQQNQDSLELVRSFIGGPGVDDLEYTRYHGRNLWHLKDMLGSTIGLTNNSGRTIGRIGYDAWGNLDFPDKPGHAVPPCKSSDLNDLFDRYDHGRSFGQGIDPWHFARHFNAEVSPYLYAGRRLDAFSSNYFNRNRYYKPAVGRFISKDPIGFGGGSNLWGYTANNPVNHTDPTGYLLDIVVYDGSERAFRVMATDLMKWGTTALIDSSALPSKWDLFSSIISTAGLGLTRRMYFIGNGGPGIFYTGAPDLKFSISDLSKHFCWSFSPVICPPLSYSIFPTGIGWSYFYSDFSADPAGGVMSLAEYWAKLSLAKTYGHMGFTLFHNSGYEIYDFPAPVYSYPATLWWNLGPGALRYPDLLRHAMYGRSKRAYYP